MRIAYLDCFSGISGDMFLGALVYGRSSVRAAAGDGRGLDIGASLEISRSGARRDCGHQGGRDGRRPERFAARRVLRQHDHEQLTSATNMSIRTNPTNMSIEHQLTNMSTKRGIRTSTNPR